MPGVWGSPQKAGFVGALRCNRSATINPLLVRTFHFWYYCKFRLCWGPEARSLSGDEGFAPGRVVMAVILGDDSRNSIGGTAFHEVDLLDTLK